MRGQRFTEPCPNQHVAPVSFCKVDGLLQIIRITETHPQSGKADSFQFVFILVLAEGEIISAFFDQTTRSFSLLAWLKKMLDQLLGKRTEF